DFECRAGNGLRHRIRRGCRHSRAARFAPSRPDEAERSRQNRARPDKDHSTGKVDPVLAPDHPPWPRAMPGAQAALRRMQARSRLLREGQDYMKWIIALVAAAAVAQTPPAAPPKVLRIIREVIRPG